jgi:hypothetical protein
VATSVRQRSPTEEGVSVSPEPRNVSDLLNDFTPTVVGSASMGGSRVVVPPDERAASASDALTVFGHFLPTDFEHVTHTEEPEPPPLPEQLGPFNFSPIVFDDGVPVGGWAQLTLFRNGSSNFSGHLHVSGAPSYDTGCVFVVRAGDGTAFTFSHKGRVHGTFEAGSRDDDWGSPPPPTNDALRAGWPNLAASLNWHANAAVNMDFNVFVDDAVKAVGAVAAVIAIV